MGTAVNVLSNRRTVVLGALLVALGGNAKAAETVPKDVTEWSSGDGSWTDKQHWSDGLPNPFQRTEVHGTSTVLIPPGNYVAGDIMNFSG
jgi:hypothetical protein